MLVTLALSLCRFSLLPSEVSREFVLAVPRIISRLKVIVVANALSMPFFNRFNPGIVFFFVFFLFFSVASVFGTSLSGKMEKLNCSQNVQNAIFF